MERILGEPRDTRKFSPISLARESFGLKMKKKTTITTEKHEIWEIRRGDVADSPMTDDVSTNVDQPNDLVIVPPLPKTNDTHIDEG